MMGGDSCRSESPVSFYKIILPAIILHKKLRIPEEFAKKYGDKLSSVATFVFPDGGLWHIGLKKAEEMLWFTDGWQQLVDHYSISCGDLIVFKYVGNSSFRVLIFDITSTEIHYPCRAVSSLVSDEAEMANEVPSHIVASSPKYSSPCVTKSQKCSLDQRSKSAKEGILTEIESNKINANSSQGSLLGTKKKAKQHASVRLGKPTASVQAAEWSLINDEIKKSELGMETCFKDFFTSTLLTAQEKDGAIYAARMFASEHPSFVVIVRKYNLNKTQFMNVPPRFAAAYLRWGNVEASKGRRWPACSIRKGKGGEGVSRSCGEKVELVVSDGRRWSVCCVRRGGRGATLSCGWWKFAKENGLEVGDICVFELIRTQDVVLRASIFRKILME